MVTSSAVSQCLSNVFLQGAVSLGPLLPPFPSSHSHFQVPLDQKLTTPLTQLKAPSATSGILVSAFLNSKESRGAANRCRQFHAVVQVSQPEDMSKAVSDVKRTQFLISQCQEAQNVHVVLVSPNTTREDCLSHSVATGFLSARG